MTVLITSKKIPKRVAAHIARLEREVEEWKAKALAATSDKPNATNVFLSGHHVEADRGLPPNSAVRFRLDSKKGQSIIIEVRHEQEGLAIRSIDGLFVVRPQAANVIVLTADDFWRTT